MATLGRQSAPSLNTVIAGQYARFNVFQLVRLLRRVPEGSVRGASATGGSAPAETWPLATRLRFRADLRAGFPGHEVTRLTRAKAMPAFRCEARSGRKMPVRLELRTPNYCVASELGPLPEPFLEWVRDQERVGGHAMAAFLDVFNQRVHVLRHELKLRSLRALDPALPAQTRYAAQLAALMGVALPDQQAQIPLPMRAWLGLSGLLVNSRKSPAVVAQILTAYLGVECRLQTLVGRWRDIEDADRMALGRRQHALGRQSLLGRRTWDAHASVRLYVGRMRYDTACALLPLRATRSDDAQPNAAHRGLVAMIRMLLDRRFDCEVELILDSSTVPPSRLSLPWRGGGLGLRLGQTAWLGRHTGPPSFPLLPRRSGDSAPRLSRIASLERRTERPLRFTVEAFDRLDGEAAA